MYSLREIGNVGRKVEKWERCGRKKGVLSILVVNDILKWFAVRCGSTVILKLELFSKTFIFLLTVLVYYEEALSPLKWAFFEIIYLEAPLAFVQCFDM